MILKLTNNKNTYSFEVEDLNNGEKLFYHFQIPTADMEDGNYKMVLLDGDEIVTEEQVCIGAFNPQAIQYSRGENVYINAPFEANLEDVKEVEITAIETTVLPSEGYDGIKAVEVNAQPIFDDGYNVGNAEGIEVGKAEQKTLLIPISITENGTYENENGYSTIEVNVPDTNGSYDEGYTDGYAEGEAKGVENAGSIIAETARVLDITENGLYVSRYSEPTTPDVIPEGNLIKTVNVNVVPKIDIAKAGITFAYSSFSSVPEWGDFSNVTDMKNMFRNCDNLTSIPQLVTSNVTNMSYMFSYCTNLTTIPLLDTSNVTEISDMFSNCYNLTSIPPLNASKINSNGPFGFSDLPNITDVGGFIDLKQSWNNSSYGLVKLPNLTYQSCINVLNGLFDFTGNGFTPSSYEGKLKVHQNFLNLVGDEISIGVEKGWIISA